MISQLDMELFVNSPTFRRQVASALTDVGVERWKAAVATDIMVSAAVAAGTATPQQLIAQTLAKTEKGFLESALALQGVNIGSGSQASSYTTPIMAQPNTEAAKEGITRLINTLLMSPSWTLTVADWIANQETAMLEIQERMNEKLGSLAAAPIST